MRNTLRFGEWTFNRHSHVLTRAGESVRLEPRVASLLEYFLERRGELLSHDDLVENVWEGRVVSDEAIRRAVSALRRAIGTEDPQEIIQTVHGCGYMGRFPVSEDDFYPESPSAAASGVEAAAGGIPGNPYVARLKEVFRKLNRRMHFKAWLAVGAGALTIEILAGLIVDFLESPHDATLLPAENSLAIVPFEVCEEGTVDRQLAGGLTGAIYNRLARRNKLNVIGRTSAETVARSAMGPSAVAGLLGVRYVLAGEVCRAEEGNLTLHAELTDQQGFTVWQRDFSERVNAYDQVQDQLAVLVDNGVAANFGDATRETPPRAVDRRALEYLLIGREYKERGDRDKARESLEKALELQPGYAEAKVELSWLDGEISDWGNVEDGYRKAHVSLEEAVRLAEAELLRNPSSFDANRVAGRILFGLGLLDQQLAFRSLDTLGEKELQARFDRAMQRFTRAEEYLRVALAINPGASTVRRRLAQTMAFLGADKRRESLDVLLEGLDWDPFNEELSIYTATRLIEFGRVREAMESLDRFDVLPEGKSPGQLWWQLEMLFNLGRVDESLARLIDLLDYKPEQFWGVAVHYARLLGGIAHIGLTEEAEGLYQLALAMPRPPNVGEHGWEHMRRFFLIENYMVMTGRAAEGLAPRVERMEGLSNDEILAAFGVDIYANAYALWENGYQERAIELYQALYLLDTSPALWPERNLEGATYLVRMLMTVGRDNEAFPVLEKIVEVLEEEVEVGVRHPETLMRLAEAYGWLGRREKALSTLELAVEYGANLGTEVDISMCCETLRTVQSATLPFGGERTWWADLVDEPRLQRANARLLSTVEQQRMNVRALLAMHDMQALLGRLRNPDVAGN